MEKSLFVDFCQIFENKNSKIRHFERFSKTLFYRGNSFFVQGATMWNSLPLEFRSALSTETFKKSYYTVIFFWAKLVRNGRIRAVEVHPQKFRANFFRIFAQIERSSPEIFGAKLKCAGSPISGEKNNYCVPFVNYAVSYHFTIEFCSVFFYLFYSCFTFLFFLQIYNYKIL
jgi:hypothetical protein